MPCTLRRADRPRAHHDGRLGPGRSAAPGDDRLVLLPSGPDTVRGSPLRGTRSSTSRRRAAFENGDLGRGFSPAVADCRYRAPLVPRLARLRKDSADAPAVSARPRGRASGPSAAVWYPLPRRGVRVVDGAALEKRCAKAPRVRIPPSPPRPNPDLPVSRRQAASPSGERSPSGLWRRTGNAVWGNPSRVRIPPSPPPRPERRRRAQRAGTVSNRAAASSRRMPLTILIRRGIDVCWASWMTEPGGAVVDVRHAKTSASTSLCEQRPDAHRAGLLGREDRGVGEADRPELAGGLAQGDDHGVGGRVVGLLDAVVRRGRPSPRRPRRRPRPGARPRRGRASPPPAPRP